MVEACHQARRDRGDADRSHLGDCLEEYPVIVELFYKHSIFPEYYFYSVSPYFKKEIGIRFFFFDLIYGLNARASAIMVSSLLSGLTMNLWLYVIDVLL